MLVLIELTLGFAGLLLVGLLLTGVNVFVAARALLYFFCCPIAMVHELGPVGWGMMAFSIVLTLDKAPMAGVVIAALWWVAAKFFSSK